MFRRGEILARYALRLRTGPLQLRLRHAVKRCAKPVLVGSLAAVLVSAPVWLEPMETAVADIPRFKGKKQEEYDGVVFRKVYPILERALGVFKEGQLLPETSWLWRDRRSTDAEIDKLADQALDALKVSELGDIRKSMRDLEDQVDRAQRAIAEYRKARVTAPASLPLPYLVTELGKNMPSLGFLLTKDAFDDFIAAEERNVAEYRREQNVLREQLGQSAADIGLVASRDALTALLDSVAGDDVVSMGIVFSNVKTITSELSKLTEQSGEAIDVAQRYYGMYLVLVRILHRTQRKFLENIDEEYLPKLHQFVSEAKSNISEAETALRKLPDTEEADRQEMVLRANMEANALTMKVAQEYQGYVKALRQMIAERERETQSSLSTALNTYKTVTLSVNVTNLLQGGAKNFEALMALQMPDLRIFENLEMRKEFQGLTARIRKK